jgi:molybdenum cofactor cytidylyltransferase
MTQPARPRIGAVLLAGGRGRRFGADKRQARLPGGLGLLETTVRRYAGVFDALRVVLREDEVELAQRLEPALAAGPTARDGRATDRRVVFSARADGGMGCTLADGMATVTDWDVAFVGLGDMPFVTHTTLALLRAAAQGAFRPPAPLAADGWQVLQPQHVGLPGHPVGFRAALFPALRALAGDEGARTVVQAHRSTLWRLTVSDAGVLQDVDTPDNLPRR